MALPEPSRVDYNERMPPKVKPDAAPIKAYREVKDTNDDLEAKI